MKRKFVIFSPNWIGDAVMATPMVSALRQAFPDAHIALVTNAYVRDIWQHNPMINEIICFDLPPTLLAQSSRAMIGRLTGAGFDTALILSHYARHAALAFFARIPVRIGYNVRRRRVFLTHSLCYSDDLKKRHMVENYFDFLRSLGIRATPGPLIVRVDESARQRAREFLIVHGITMSNLLVGIAPGACFGPAKRWPVSYYGALIKSLIENFDAQVLVFTGSRDRAVSDGLKKYNNAKTFYCDKTESLAEVAALIACCGVCISNDSGLMHVAAAMGVRTVGIFGSTSPQWTQPYGVGHCVVRSNALCSPCFRSICVTGTYECLHSIRVQDVVAAFRKQLKDEGKTVEDSRFCGSYCA